MFNIKKQNSVLIFTAIALFYAAGNFLWWLLNTPVFPNDVIAITHYTQIFVPFNQQSAAPLITYIMKVLFYCFGMKRQDLLIIIVNYIFFLIPLYFIYKIGLELKDKKTANIAMVLFALVPAVYGMSRMFGHKDYHIIAAITFNVYCLIKTNWFANRKWSLIYGISIGLGLLVKDPFIGYFAPLFVYAAARGFVQGGRAKVLNILIAPFAAFAIAAAHYTRRQIIFKILYDFRSEAEPIFAFNSLKVMTAGLWEELLSPPIFILFIIGLVFFIIKYKNKNKHIILLWFFAPWLMIIFMGHYKVAEYGAGFIPAMVLIAAVWVSGITHNARRIVLGAVIIIGIFQYVCFSYQVINLPDWKIHISHNAIRYYNRHNENIIYYDKLKMQRIRNFVLDLKKMYPNAKFYMWEYSYNVFGYSELQFQMFLNGIEYIEDWFADTHYNVGDSDVIIYVGGLKIFNEIFQIYKARFEQYPQFDKEDIENCFNELQKTQKIIDEQFFIAHTFYLNKLDSDFPDMEPGDYQVILLERRDNNV